MYGLEENKFRYGERSDDVEEGKNGGNVDNGLDSLRKSYGNIMYKHGREFMEGSNSEISEMTRSKGKLDGERYGETNSKSRNWNSVTEVVFNGDPTKFSKTESLS